MLSLTACVNPRLYRPPVRRMVDEDGPYMTDPGSDSHELPPSRPGLPSAMVEDDRGSSAPADRESFVIVPEHQASAVRTYQVKRGDSLSIIARRFYGEDWEAASKRIYESNRDILRSPDDLVPGIELRLP